MYFYYIVIFERFQKDPEEGTVYNPHTTDDSDKKG